MRELSIPGIIAANLVNLSFKCKGKIEYGAELQSPPEGDEFQFMNKWVCYFCAFSISMVAKECRGCDKEIVRHTVYDGLCGSCALNEYSMFGY
jgi:hypothetical protein